MESREVTLGQLLESRDRRQALQRELLASHPRLTLLVFTVVMPGSVKRNDSTQVIAQAGMQALDEAFRGAVVDRFVHDESTGFEGWYLLDMPEDEAKRVAVGIEDRHPLGRLMDIDVIRHDGTPMLRHDIGHGGRKCLMCDCEAHMCMRLRRHPIHELQSRITRMVEDYVQGV